MEINKIKKIIREHGFDPEEFGFKFNDSWGWSVFGVDNPSSKSISKALDQYPEIIAFVNKSIFPVKNYELTEKDKINIVKKDPFLIRFIKDPSEKVKLSAVENGLVISELIDDSNKNLHLQLFSVNKGCLIKNPTPQLQAYIVEKDPSLIKFIKEPCEKAQIIVINQDPFFIRYIDSPAEKVQIKAITENRKSFLLIKNPTVTAMKLAVERYSDFLLDIESPPESVQQEAIKSDSSSIICIEKPSKKIQKFAIDTLRKEEKDGDIRKFKYKFLVLLKLDEDILEKYLNEETIKEII